MIKHAKCEGGQTQILIAISFSIILLGGALFSLTQSQIQTDLRLRFTQRTKLRAAIDAAARFIQRTYSSSSCDPAVFADKVSFLNEDQTFRKNNPLSPSYQKRSLSIDVSGTPIYVQFGKITLVSGNTDIIPNNTAGQTQDVSIELWANLGDSKITQTVVLINSCALMSDQACTTDSATGTETCNESANSKIKDLSGTGSWPITVATTDANLVMNRIVAGLGVYYPKSSGTSGENQWHVDANSGSAWMAGDVDAYQYVTASAKCNPSSAAGSTNVDIRDLIVLRNFVRTGNAEGSCLKSLTGLNSSTDEPGLVSTVAIGDFTGDGIVNDLDVSFLEKFLRGYVLHSMGVGRRVPPTSTGGTGFLLY